VSVAGENVTMGAGAGVPVPVSVAVCGELAALSVTVRVALKVAAEVGVKVTEMVQVEDTASVEPQVVVWAKSEGLAPVSEIPVMLSTALPVFESVRVCAAEVVPAVVLGKVSVPPDKEATGAGAGVPVPVSAAVCGEPVELSATVRVALKVVAEAGVKVTEIAQVEDAARDEPQVLVWAKSEGLDPVSEMPVMLSAALPVFESVMV